jgi:hypothetical protein
MNASFHKNYEINTPKKFRHIEENTENRSTDAGRSRLISRKMMECFYCSKKFLAQGTRKYCNDQCKNDEKRNRQNFVDNLGAQIKKGLYANYKLFREYLPGSGSQQINYDMALKKGFDEHAFYGTFNDSQKLSWRRVGDYYFIIMHEEENRLLHIYKR